MVALTIPPQYLRGYAVLRGLEEDQTEELVSALKEVQPTRNRVGLHSRVASKAKSIGRSELDKAMDVLLSLFSLRDDLDMSTLELVGAISEAVDQSELEGLPFSSQESRESFEAMLIQILEIESLGVAAKAISLVYEQDHIVHAIPRVLTDLRPIFSSDPAETYMQGAMVTQTLKLEYHEGDEVTELFVALNAQQVDRLIDVLERAKSKAESLKQFVQQSPDIYYAED